MLCVCVRACVCVCVWIFAVLGIEPSLMQVGKHPTTEPHPHPLTFISETVLLNCPD